ncbi:branched-chain amino acid ABC transporter permease [Dactylosporangium sp. CA-139066]|uniref:branched-chain amino acid ABC transporter permease n=1 Tax=Dactylosporangium sp. CA-139066 TaxID=3239930 RepID=UPI003D91A6AF
MAVQLVNALVLGGIYVLFALGLSLTWGTLNILNLAHGAVFMFSAFACYLITERWHLAFPLLVVIAMLVGGAMSLLLDVVVFRAIRSRVQDEAKAELAMLIASLGAATIPLSIAQRMTSDQPFSLAEGSFKTRIFRIGAVPLTNDGLAIFILAIVLVVGLAVWVRKSRNGRALRALAADPETCGLMGINPRALTAFTLFFAGATAGLGGILLMAHLGSITPMTGETLLLKAFACVILGGVGSVWGTLAGAYVLAFSEVIMTVTTSGTYTDAISFAIIIAILLIRPQGLFSRAKVDRV